MAIVNAECDQSGHESISNLDRKHLPGPQYLDQLISTQRPNELAIEYHDTKGNSANFTYDLLESASNRLATYLQQHLEDAAFNLVVPVVLSQNPALYISYVAVLKCGAAFCPIAPDTPDERIKFIVQDVAAKVVLCSLEMANVFQILLPSILCIGVDWEELSSLQPSSLSHKPRMRKPSDVAYLMYTSGSTGKPKGVPISHGSVVQSLLAHHEHIPPFRRFLQFAAPTFDVSIFEIFFTWYRGSTLVSCDRETMLADLPGVVDSHNIDAVELTPTVVATLLRERVAVPGLKILLTIGEMLTSKVIKEFGGDDAKESILFAMYGPTEASIHCTIVPRMRCSSSVHNIGHPLSTVTAFIIQQLGDEDKLRVLGTGEEGELAVAGQLATGYLNQTEQTSKAFLELPGYGQVYRTGDRAVLTSNGELHILGRIATGQVKLRGQRIELGEIEVAASQAEHLQTAVALVIDQILVLFCSGTALLTSTDIEKSCSAWLPRHMRPGDIVIYPDGLPQLPSGKVDRPCIQERYERARHANEVDPKPSMTETEAYLSKIISQELLVKVNKHTSLWTCGLDSLRAIRVASRLRATYPHVTMSVILEAETISELDRVLTEVCSHAPTNEAHHVVSSDRQVPWNDGMTGFRSTSSTHDAESVLPCSPIQIGMLYETQREPLLYMNLITLQHSSTVSFDTIRQAFKTIADRNKLLRAAFCPTDDVEMPFVQVIRQAPEFDQEASIQNPVRLTRGSTEHTVEVTMHHALYDGWSWDLIMRDLNSLLRGVEIPGRPQYQDMAEAERSQRAMVMENELSAWTDRLSDFEPTEFPVLRAEEYRGSGRAHHQSILQMGRTVLSQLAHDLHISSAAIAHSALNLVLCKLLDTSKVTTGLVIAGRDPVIPDATEVIGPCLSMLPLFLQLNEAWTLRDLMLEVYQGHMHCVRHARISYVQIKSTTKHPAAGHMFDVLFVWQESLYSASDGKEVVVTTATHDRLDYALVVEIEPTKDALRLRTTYDRAFIHEDQIDLMHCQLDALIQLSMTHSDSVIQDLWQDMDKSLLSISNAAIRRTHFLHPTSTIARIAREDPNRLAVDFVMDFEPQVRRVRRKCLTYLQLHDESMRAARLLLTTFELRGNDIVAIWSEKSVEMYVMICAALQAGIAYTCIDQQTPETRIKEILLQSNTKLLFTDNRNALRYGRAFDLPAVAIEDLTTYSGPGFCDLQSDPKPNDLAYAVFTSGSTGTPKGVLVSRANLMSNIQHLESVYPHDSNSHLLQSCSPAFDVSVFEIVWTWHCGMTLTAATNDVLFRDIESFIDTLSITHLSMTPSVAALVDPCNVPDVRVLVCSGEPMSAKVFEAWVNHGLYQGYGPSETTNICNVRDYQDGRKRMNNVGKPFPNTSIFICLRLLPDTKQRALTVHDFRLTLLGAVGEIWIGGEQVAHGYTNEDLTSRSWLEHPEYGRLYRSGDIGRLLVDGSLVILGREDDQAKIRGQRVELNDIDSKLIQSHLVLDALSMVLEAEVERQKLVSFWVHPDRVHDFETVTELLYDHLRNTLPGYMVPELLIPIPTMPLTQQGKVDRRKLRAAHADLSYEQMIQYSATVSSDEELEPATAEETQIIRALSEVTGMPTVNIKIHASFFTYGIDSIRAVHLAQKIRNFGFGHFDVSDIMKHASVKKLASHYLRSLDHTKGQRIDVANTIPRKVKSFVSRSFGDNCGKIKDILPVTPLQEAMLSASAARENTSYLNQLTYRLFLDPQLVKSAWSAMMERHAMLRTVFATTEDVEWPYVQIVLDGVDVPWTESTNARAISVPSIFGWPPYALRLRYTQDDVSELDLFLHHALYDAEALSFLQSEMEAFLRQEELSPPSPFRLYLDCMVNIDELASNNFWDTHLTKILPCRLSEISGSGARKSAVTSTTRRCPMTLSRLSAAAKLASTTLLALFEVSVTRLLSIYLDKLDICFGSVLSGRNIGAADLSRVVGPCFNTLPIRSTFRRRATNGDLCRQLQQFNSEVLPFQPTSLRYLQRQYSSDGQPLFDLLLLYQSSSAKLDRNLWQLVEESGQMEFPLILEVKPDPEADKIDITLHNLVLDGQLLETKLLDDFCTLLIDTVERPNGLAIDAKGVVTPWHRKASANGNPDQDINAASQQAARQNTRSSHTGQVVLAVLATLAKRNIIDIKEQLNIFQLGLDSIHAVQLASRLRKAGFPISAGSILEKPTVLDIIRLCNETPSHEEISLPPHSVEPERFDKLHRQSIIDQFDLRSEDIESVWPCTATQSGILSEHVRSAGYLYLNHLSLRLDSKIDLHRLAAALTEVIGKNAMLRTGFAEVEDAKYPFAMIVYSKSSSIAHQLPLIAHQLQPKSFSIRNLSVPPWSIEVVVLEDGCQLKISILHALYDAHSMHLILRDIASCYYGQTLPQTPSIRQTLTSILTGHDAESTSMRFWHQLRTRAQSTSFPNLNSERLVSSALNLAKSTIDINLSHVQSHCEALGCSLSAASQVAWARVLRAYTGQQSVAFGIVLSGRSFEQEDLNDVVFPCINILPVIVDVHPDRARMIRQTALFNAELHKNPHLPITRVKKLLEVDTRLFDTLLALQTDSREEEDVQVPWQVVDEQATAEYALSMELIPRNDKLILQLTSNQTCIPAEYAHILLKQYEWLLYDTLNLKMPSRLSRGQIWAYRRPKHSLLRTNSRTLHELVLKHATQNRHHISLEYVDSIEGVHANRRTWTYGDLIKKASQIANLLLTCGARPRALVAVCFEKCPEASFALLGVLLAGCAYVAVDPSAPASRRSFILRDANCNIMLTTTSVSPGADENAGIQTICIDDVELLGQQSDSVPAEAYLVKGDDICYCLYTSGTTGKPKGCLINHTSAVQAMRSFSQIFRGHWDSDSRWLQFAAYHFDVSILEHFWSWSEGVRVTVVPKDILFEDMPGTINSLKITHLDLTPSLARLLTPELVPSLVGGVFIVGGEQLRQDIIDVWGESNCLYNFYGPSEVTIGCTVRPRVQKNVRPTNIGWQWDNVGTYVLDPASEERVLIGAIGELCLSGPLVGKGYLNRPDLTSQKFVTLQSTGERVYRTGDLVRMLHDYSLEFLGRIDDQVKLRGQRLEIGEINHCLSHYSEIFKDVTTLVLKHPSLEKEQLVAFFAQDKRPQRGTTTPHLIDADCDVTRIREYALESLPGYMVPTYVLIVDSLPLTINNKVDAKALKTLFESTPFHEIRARQELNWPGSKVHSEDYERLIRTVAKYVKVDTSQIDPSTSIIQLGIDSISAIGFSRLLRSQGYATATTALVLKHSIIGDLCNALCAGGIKDHEAAGVDIVGAQKRMGAFAAKHRQALERAVCSVDGYVQQIALCTPLQEAMITRMTSSEAKQPPYLTKFVYRLDNDVELSRLYDAWDELKIRLDILRVHFAPTEDGYAQVVMSDTSSCKLYHEVGFINDDPLTTVDQSFQLWAKSARRLDRITPWKVWLTQRQGGQVKHMSIFMFHGIYDGVSIPLLLDAVNQLYIGSSGDASTGPQFIEALPYGPLSINHKAQKFWCSSLQRTELLGLDSEDRAEQSVTLREVVYLPALRDQAKVLYVTPQAIFHAAWLYTLGLLCDINPTIGILLSGRSINFDAADAIIGPMFNTLPFTVDIAAKSPNQTATLSDLIKACHELNVEILPFQHTSLSDIRKYVKAQGELFDSLFVYQGLTAATDSNWPWKEVQSDSIADYPLNTEVAEFAHNKYDVTIVSSVTSVRTTEVPKIMQTFVHTLKQLEEVVQTTLPSVFFRIDVPKVAAHRALPIRGAQNLTAFEETEESSYIRLTIADLAGVSASSIGASKPTIFELGLDSVDALKLGARLKARGIALPVSKILQSATVAGMAEQWTLIQERQNVNGITLPGLPIQMWYSHLQGHGFDVADIEAVMPVTPMQEGLLLDFSKYYNTVVHKLENGTDVGRFTSAVYKSVQSLPILRTRFVMLEDAVEGVRYLQVIAKPRAEGCEPNISCRPKDLSEMEKELENIRLNASIEDSTARIWLALLENGTTYLVTTLSHALYDGWSLQLLFHHVNRQYNELTTDGQDTGATWRQVENIRNTAHTAANSDFWSKQLMDAQATLILPMDDAETPSLLERSVSKIGVRTLRAACRKHGISVQSMGLAVWTLVLMQLSGRQDVNFGVVVSGRMSEEAERMIFPTFNTIIFRPRLGTEVDKRGLLHLVHMLSTEVYEHQQFPLSQALRLAGSAGPEVFNTLFTYQKTPQLEAPGQAVMHEVELSHSQFSPPYAVNVEMEEVQESLVWTLATQEGVMTADKMQTLFQDLDTVLGILVTDDDEQIFRPVDNQMSICGLPAIQLKSRSQPKEVYLPGAESSTGQASAETWSATERAIRDVFANVSAVAVSEIAKSTSMFNLGLDSVSAIKVTKLLRESGLKVAVSAILKGQTVSRIAAAINDVDSSRMSQGQIDKSPLIDVDTVTRLHDQLDKFNVLQMEIEAILPATGGQTYMLDMWRASKGRLMYATFWLEVQHCTEVVLRTAFETLVRRVALMRTAFVDHANRYFQVVLRPGSKSKSPWTYLIKSDGDTMLLTLHMHHALYDAVSLDLMLRELQELCRDSGGSTGARTDFQPFIRLTTAQSLSLGQGSRQFWTRYLNGVQKISIGGSFTAERKELFVPDVMPTLALTRIARQQGISVQAIFFAVVARIYATTWQGTIDDSSRSDVVIGVYLANRSLDLDGITNLIAPTFNIVPLKVSVSGDESLIDAASKVQVDLQEISRAEHCGVNLRDVYAWTGAKLDCYVNFLKLPEGHDDLADTSGLGQEDDRTSIKHASGQAREQAKSIRMDAGPAPFLNGSKQQDGDMEWCAAGVDVEAKIESDGQLAIGIFAPEDVVDDETLRRLIDEVRQALLEVAGSDT